MPAYFAKTFAEFMDLSEAEIRSSLDDGYSADGFNYLYTPALDSWRDEVAVLKVVLPEVVAARPVLLNAGILLEFWIPRRMRRADVIMLIRGAIVVLEFKPPENWSGAFAQVEDYALDLADFHEPSRSKHIFPVVVSGKAKRMPFLPSQNIQPTQAVTREELGSLILEISAIAADTSQIDVAEWNNGRYCPVPTILEAARAMFAGMEVREIAAADTDPKNLTDTIDAIRATVTDAKCRDAKVVCLVTGVPGAGKTLAGLRAVHDPQIAHESGSCLAFLSGNGPLVKVLQRALTEERRDRENLGLRVAQRDPETLIQGVYGFKRELWRSHEPPAERIIVFDEAQRAWDRKHNAKKLKAGDGYPFSEPGLLLDIMGRHQGWAVLVLLIGSGQEIHEGEAGLSEWGRALNAQPAGKWEVKSSPQALAGGAGMANSRLFEDSPRGGLKIETDGRLHLDNPTRQIRGKKVARWVDALLEGESENAAEALVENVDYPILLTRDLGAARHWLRKSARGSERYGLVASSAAGRLRAYGIETDNTFHKGIPIHHWFLRDAEDYRSSYKLEVATTEFEIQGLELDWVGVCWGGDMQWDVLGQCWDLRHLDGPGWRPTKNEMDRRYTINTYRVLLTRARRGMVIFVPPGIDSDSTLSPAGYENTTSFLASCGCALLEEARTDAR